MKEKGQPKKLYKHFRLTDLIYLGTDDWIYQIKKKTRDLSPLQYVLSFQVVINTSWLTHLKLAFLSYKAEWNLVDTNHLNGFYIKCYLQTQSLNSLAWKILKEWLRVP